MRLLNIISSQVTQRLTGNPLRREAATPAWLALALCLAAHSAGAQTITISGQVRGSNGSAAPGVTVDAGLISRPTSITHVEHGRPFTTRPSTTLDFGPTIGGFPGVSLTNNFGLVATANYTPQTTGVHYFALRSDDGADLRIETLSGSPVLIIDNDGLHASSEKQGSASLSAGTTYRIKVRYFEAEGEAELELRFLGVGSPGAGTPFAPPGGFNLTYYQLALSSHRAVTDSAGFYTIILNFPGDLPPVQPLLGLVTAFATDYLISPGSINIYGSRSDVNFVVTASPPIISTGVPSTTMSEDTESLLIFTVRDLQTDNANLVVTATSSNPSLIPGSAIQITPLGSDARRVRFRPLPNANGSTVLTVTVRDQENRTASAQSTVNVSSVNDAPIAGSKHALAFDGSDDEVVAPALVITNTSFTIEAWARRDSLNRWDMLATQGTSTPNQGLHFGFRDNNRFTFGFWANDLDYPTPMLDTNWHHWAGTYDISSGLRRIYLDGLVVAQDTTANAFQGIGPFLLGHAPIIGNSYFRGTLDEVRVWSVARPGPEIAIKRFEPLVGNETGLVAYWRLDEAGTIVALDSSRNGKNGSLTYPNGPAWVIRPDHQPQGWGVRLVSESSPGWPIYLPGFDVDSPGITYSISGLTTGSVNRSSGSISNLITPHNPILYTPPPFYSGDASFQLVVSDGTLSDTNTILISVESINDPPVIAVIPDQVVLEDGVLGPLEFLVSDPDDPADELIVTADSGDRTVIPLEGLRLSGTGTNRTITIVPAAGESGTVEITLNAFDGELTSERRFVVRVEPRPAYRIFDLGSLSGRPTAFGIAVNDLGAALGDASQNAQGQSRRAFIFEGLESASSLTEVGTLGGATSSGAGLNNFGEVVGTSLNSQGFNRAFIRDPNTSTLRELGTTVGGTTSFGTAINDDGNAAGFGPNGSNKNRAFLYNKGPALLELGPLSTYSDASQAFGLNISNLVAGASFDNAGRAQATLWSASSTNALGFLPGGNHSVAYAINRFGLVVGLGNTTASTGLVQRGFVWNGGTMTSIGTLPGGVGSEARALNSFGQIVGSATVSNETRAIFFSAGQLYDLNDLVPEEDQLDWRLSQALGINARGEIVGTGTLRGVPRAFLAVPANVIGRKVTRPAGSVAGVPPQIELLGGEPGDTAQNAFHFSPATGKLYAIRPVTARVKWATSTNPLDTNAPPIAVLNVNVWPRTPQIHVAGAPVEAQPSIPGFAYSIQTLLHTTSPGANVDGGSKVFNATQPGYSVLYYLRNEGQQVNPQSQPPYFEVVRTFIWNNPRVFTSNVDNVPVPIGSPVVSPFHRDHPGRNGWMHFENSFYDGAGTERAYDRATRTGPILPVNRDTSSATDDFVVVWYATNAIHVSWACQPVRYTPEWPADASEIVIASTLGSGDLDFLTYGFHLRVYNQPNPNLPGFNPNEEHALITASNGGVSQALFALRDDLNIFQNYSEPYALLKYRNPVTDEWRIKPFRVVETNAQYRFSYSGTAGNEIAPPYPLSILNLCDTSHGVEGPYWEDYNGKIYARAAGVGMDLSSHIVIHWWYPLQPGFFYDLNGDGTNDVQQGTCLGLLEERPVADPRAPKHPVDVGYTIQWPNAPVLQTGETVLRAKHGLPDVLNFASAEVIWDSSNPTIDLTGTNLLTSAVRLFDPLGDRVLKVPETTGLSGPGNLFEIPSMIRTYLDPQGKVRFTDLPPDIASRLAYDPLNRWFIFSGILDELRTAGEPFYLLNILTERERERIKDLDGPTGSSTDWDKILDALYDLTRNPNRIDVFPLDGQPDQALRVGFTTNSFGQVVLEKLPENKALTAAIGDAPAPLPLPGNALSFDGANDYLDAGVSVDLADASFAIEFWAKRTTTGPHIIVTQGSATPHEGLEIGFRSDNRFIFSFFEATPEAPLVTSQTFTDLEWHHWAVTYQQTTGQRVIYRDGIAVASDIVPTGYSGTGPLWIARGLTGSYFNGTLDDVRIWNLPRTAFTVARDRSKRLIGTEEGLLRYFRFDEASGSAAQDSSERSLPATLAGASRVTSTAPTGIPPRYVTIAENSDELLELPVSLHVIRIDDGPFTGQLNDIAPPNVFSEKISIRHSSDFGAEPERLSFEWWYKPDNGGVDPTDLPVVDPVSGDVLDPRGWLLFTAYTPADGQGVNYVTLGDGGQTSLLTLGDNWFVMRYRGFNVNGAVPWSDWAGDPSGGSQSRAKLVEGWIKRVLRGINPFDQRVSDFHKSQVNTFASMLVQAGPRYEGDVAFNPDADAINSVGLIQVYETVLRRGKRLSIDGTPAVNFDAANNALLLVSSKIADLYVLLGNEAYADASDPTIGFGTSSGEYGTAASSIFAFQNQLDSLLDEELTLLRGRDDRGAGVAAAPVYNRLFWNFTLGEGEVAYQQAYNISDQTRDGFLDERDARLMYPQGHGDAWGHYLTALKAYYQLLRHERFTWVPRPEHVLLNGVAVEVDFLDERKFAHAAAARARAGAEIVNLTYRRNYVDEPSGQWQGYKDSNLDRAWGVDEWGRRAGQGAIFDWVVANALLPFVDPNTNHVGIERIDRTTVVEISEIPSRLEEIQTQLDQADIGLNPLGLAKGALSFDIDPTFLEVGSTAQIGRRAVQGLTQFDQILERAITAMNNAVTVWDRANLATELLRRNQDTQDEFRDTVIQQERDFRNRLIEIFGYPYAGDIGPGKTYPSGYEGPDLYHYMYVSTAEITGENSPPSPSFAGFFRPVPDGDGYTFYTGVSEDFRDNYNPFTLETDVLEVTYPQVAGNYTFGAPAEWGERRAPGQLQEALSEIVQQQARLKQTLQNYDGIIRDIEDALQLLEAVYNVHSEKIDILDARNNAVIGMNVALASLKTTQIVFERASSILDEISDETVEAVPQFIIGGLAFGGDTTSAARATLMRIFQAAKLVSDLGSDTMQIAQLGFEYAKEGVANQAEVDLEIEDRRLEVLQNVKEIESKLRAEAAARLEVYTQREILAQSMGRYRATLAEGERAVQEMIAFRQNAAAQTSEARYEDMTFRIFRNDALQKYRSAFDVAARYVYLAANAYDYEINFAPGEPRAGSDFLTDIIRQRSLGEIVDGSPTVGQPGLADPLGRLEANWSVLRTQFGVVNPQITDTRFSLREELFRIKGDEESDGLWREVLTRARIANLWDLPEFRRFCRPFAPQTLGPQPAVVIRFPTTVTFGLNFFGWPLAGGDNNYDPSQFSTKIARAGIWLSGSDGTRIAQTPRVYLVPVGMDVMRSPSGDTLGTREWRIIDQTVPPPFPIGANALKDPDWIPQFDSLGGTFAQIRRYAAIPARHDEGIYSESDLTNDTRLVGRSAWNTDWLLIIPGGTLLADPDAGLDAFIETVRDIKLYFQTYSYSGI